MAASKHIHPDQLKMFMTPQEVMGIVGDSVDRQGYEEMDDLWDRKSADLESKFSGHGHLQEAVDKDGVKTPVILQVVPRNQMMANTALTAKPWLKMGNGHHRVVAAENKQDKTGNKEVYIPVIHDKDYMGSPQLQNHYPQMRF